MLAYIIQHSLELDICNLLLFRKLVICMFNFLVFSISELYSWVTTSWLMHFLVSQKVERTGFTGFFNVFQSLERLKGKKYV